MTAIDKNNPQRIIAGVDEVGRGCIVGPVIAAVVILDAEKAIAGLTDSKKLSPTKREKLSRIIQSEALDFAIGRAEPSEIDTINILQASLLAMARAFAMLRISPDWVKVDGIHYPPINCPGETVIQGDLQVAEISAASIIAKVARDNEMQTLDRLYPGYEFSKHKGYPTKLHLEKLKHLGITPLHRKSYAPVKKVIT
jgi:ribonuclease HII